MATNTKNLALLVDRHSWENIDGCENISIESPEPIVIDRAQQLHDWKLKIDSNVIFEIS